MLLYVLTEPPDVQDPAWTSSGADVPLYGVRGGWGLPVFTSKETFDDFVSVRYAGCDGIPAGVYVMSPLELTGMVRKLRADVDYVLFDPAAEPDGGLRLRCEPVTTADHLRAVERIWLDARRRTGPPWLGSRRDRRARKRKGS